MRICLIGPLHVAFNPRLLREADTLAEAGHDVRVVCRQSDPVLRDLDARVMKGRRWKLQAVDICRQLSPRWLAASVQAKAYEKTFSLGIRTGSVASRAYVRGFTQLRRAAEAEYSDWFIAHTHPGLPIAAAAARKWKAKLGFDCEDLLSESGGDSPDMVRAIERTYLSRCDYVSTPSANVARRLADQYQIRLPLVLYNVFPLKLAEGLVSPMDRPACGSLRLHWFSQTIGEGRGLEEAIQAAKLIGTGVELHLRGRVSGAYRRRLERLAEGVDLRFHPIVPYDELIRTLDQFDVGLAVESKDNNNAARTVSNKLFSYMLAGLAIAATDTPGQREVMGRAPTAGFLYSSGQPEDLAKKLRGWIDDPESLRMAQQSSWNISREQFCWDIEKDKLFSMLRARSVVAKH